MEVYNEGPKIRTLNLLAYTLVAFLSLSLCSYITPTAFLSYIYFLIFWVCILLIFHRRELIDFVKSYLICALATIIYFVVQINVYPDSYGTTHPLGSWTDDSFYFALAADALPPNLFVRDFYWLYDSFFAQILKFITPFKITHPVDTIFFVSGVWAILPVFTGRLALAWTGDASVANAAYYMSLFSPIYWMFGGSILVRDTFTAACFVYSILCVQEKRFLAALIISFLLLALRPASAFLAVVLCLILFWRPFIYNRKMWVGLFTVIVGSFATIYLLQDVLINYIFKMSSGTSEGGAISLMARELLSSTGQDGGEEVLIYIQDFPFILRLILNGIYVFLFPFFSLDSFMFRDHFDLRMVLLAGAAPVIAVWLNAWFFNGCLVDSVNFPLRKSVIVAFGLGLLIIGTYSMIGRHVTVIMPLYYIICAYGLAKSGRRTMLVAYGLAVALFFVQVIS